MVRFDDLPVKILKKYVIIENTDDRGNRLFILKKNIRKGFKNIYTSDGIPHKYQQNNTLESAESSLRDYLINEVGIKPYREGQGSEHSFWIFFRKFFRLKHP